jgi:N-acetyl-alpha-D-muramate 1-phosphate uridylyltransferase
LSSSELSRTPVAILAGGLALRMRPLTETLPKALIEIAGRPFVEHQLELLRRRGLRRVVLCIGYRAEAIEARLGDGRALGLEIQYSRDGERLMGTAGALRRAAPLLGERFFVLYGDSYLDVDYAAVLAAAHREKTPALMTVYRNEGRLETSNVLFRDGRLLAYDKRAPQREMQHVDFGLGVLHASVLERVPADEPHDLAELYRSLAADGLLAGYEVTQRFYEVGSPEGLAEMRELLK